MTVEPSAKIMQNGCLRIVKMQSSVLWFNVASGDDDWIFKVCHLPNSNSVPSLAGPILKCCCEPILNLPVCRNFPNWFWQSRLEELHHWTTEYYCLVWTKQTVWQLWSWSEIKKKNLIRKLLSTPSCGFLAAITLSCNAGCILRNDIT